ncbi:Adenosine kinase [Spraguea lophii 42_110]|uniref:Adenosine kinase n=1 Tax=Spraguea lophii (strain 42_110) TaxID=1358809 RepID=S7XG42_SPRLO|nr:Adenosine kinase [Spraguea lophii 42_110]
MARFSILFACELIIDVYLKYNKDLLERYNISEDGHKFIENDDDLKRYKPLKKILGGTSFNTFSCINFTETAFLGAISENDADEVGQLLNGKRNVHLEKRNDQPSSTCYVMIKDNKRTMVMKSGAILSLKCIDYWTNMIKNFDIFYVSLFTWNNNEEVIKAIIAQKKFKVVLNLAAVIQTYNSYDKISFIVENSEMIIGNKSEFMALISLGYMLEEDNEMSNFEFLSYMKKLAVTKKLICTNGDNSIFYIDRYNHGYKRPRKIDLEQIVTCGAGDSFAAGALDGYSAGKDIRAIADLGCEYAYNWIRRKTEEVLENDE